ncbi:EipB family protein [Mesorhizobium neociceri]|uniref:DUF1849 family protein n=1 Tax=Mesorhizobium neociceri TaxID=1307853 RepID=A0A838BC64_9HYPH|nr:DUF1849 family protein [Mesorhizobium neociceri]MBA1143842.1 DUF1849 family protein [Mesorhizobium neociceri]
MLVSTRLILVIAVLSVLPLPGTALAARVLLPHRAVYDLALVKASAPSGVGMVTGRMSYEFSGSACVGYTTQTRVVLRVISEEADGVIDRQSTTFEDPGGKSFSFVTKSYIDEELQEEVRGTATRQDEDVKVKLEKPKQQTLNIGSTLFPTQQMLDVLSRADAGEMFYETRLFDDSSEAITTSILIGKEAEIEQKNPVTPALAKGRVWPVTKTYFDESDKEGVTVPQSTLRFTLHETGIMRDFVTDNGDFSLSGKIISLEVSDMNSATCE